MRETFTDFTLFQVADITLQAVNSYSSDQAVTGSTGVIGHYTQVVWAETAEVGCGYMTSFVNDRLESVRTFLFLISFIRARIKSKFGYFMHILSNTYLINSLFSL